MPCDSLLRPDTRSLMTFQQLQLDVIIYNVALRVSANSTFATLLCHYQNRSEWSPRTVHRQLVPTTKKLLLKWHGKFFRKSSFQANHIHKYGREEWNWTPLICQPTWRRSRIRQAVTNNCISKSANSKKNSLNLPCPCSSSCSSRPMLPLLTDDRRTRRSNKAHDPAVIHK